MNSLQDFTAPPPGAATDIIPQLRHELARRRLDAFLVPRHESAPPCEQRLDWLLGFTGSRGLAIIATERAAIFVDGRYILQAREQITDEQIEHHRLTREDIAAWLRKCLAKDQRLGYDPCDYSFAEADWLRSICRDIGCDFVICRDNPADAIRQTRPPPPSGEICAHPLQYAGEDSSTKTQRIAESLHARQLDALALDRGDSIAWLLNARSRPMDAPHTPLVLSRAILHSDATLHWFVAKERPTPDLLQTLPADTHIHPPHAFAEIAESLRDKRVLLDKQSVSSATHMDLEKGGAHVSFGADPCQLPKACKNKAEREGARAAHLRDGVALCRFLAWLDGTGGGRGIDEIAAVRRLEELRQEGEHLQDISFDSIAGAGPHGAIMHYRVTEASNRPLQDGELFLLDSGGQYLDGTTDVTRTVAIGKAQAQHRRHYSLVLKGHIALAQARFPPGTTGTQLDVLARQFLWQAGLDYDHGTGHGVGSFLDVHEGPQRITKFSGDCALQEGMIISNEPGYYREGEYGIRIESLVLVTRPEAIAGGDEAMLGFETLTLAPFDASLIDVSLLSEGERAFVNDYHAKVRAAITPHLREESERAWLQRATREL